MTVITGVIIAATTIALCSILFPNKPAPKPMSDEQKLAAKGDRGSCDDHSSNYGHGELLE